MKNVETLLRENRAWAEETFRKIDRKFSAVTLRSRDKLPYGVDENGIHIDLTERRRPWWTNGFWGGLNWLLYAYTKNEEYKKTAKRSEELLRPVADEFGRLDHDVGFVWHLTFGADYLLTGDEAAKNLDLYMAASLASRFVLATKVPGGFIRAWNGKRGTAWDNYNRSIIDCMMNLPLLYWASDVTDDDRFARFAKAHADVSLRDHLREDGSVNHIVDHDRETGALTDTLAGQGYAVGSSWSRGCSWAVYGFVLSYQHTKEERYLESAYERGTLPRRSQTRRGLLYRERQVRLASPRGFPRARRARALRLDGGRLRRVRADRAGEDPVRGRGRQVS